MLCFHRGTLWYIYLFATVFLSLTVFCRDHSLEWRRISSREYPHLDNYVYGFSGCADLDSLQYRCDTYRNEPILIPN